MCSSNSCEDKCSVITLDIHSLCYNEIFFVHKSQSLRFTVQKLAESFNQKQDISIHTVCWGAVGGYPWSAPAERCQATVGAIDTEGAQPLSGRCIQLWLTAGRGRRAEPEDGGRAYGSFIGRGEARRAGTFMASRPSWSRRSESLNAW